jgi:predicted enzyme related to lactoylglutathione lyase
MNKVIFFEIPADDQERANKFYADVFGWEAEDFGGTTMVTTTELGEDGMPKTPGAINGDIFKRDINLKNPLVVIDVPSIEDHVEKIKAAGGELIVEKMPVGDMGFCAYFKDTEGNLIGIWENV